MNQNPNLNRSWEESQQIIKNLEAKITQLEAEKETKSCRCHIIDPSKMRILLWINRHKNGKPDTCVLKIAEQRLLGLPRSDRRGETYWRFDELLEKKEETPQAIFKCDQCKNEVVVIGGSDNPAQDIKQRAALKKELAQMEPIKTETNKVQESPAQAEKTEEKKTQEAKTSQPNPTKNPARQAFKEQIAQAIQENKQAGQAQEKQVEQNQNQQAKEANETNSNPVNN